MSRTKGSKGKHNKEKHVKEKKKRGRPSKQHQKQYQHQTVNVNVNGGGDAVISNYWGVAINLNSGGWANGYGGGSATQTYVPGYSAFTVNMRSSTSQTTFDRNLFTVMPSGNTTVKGLLYINSTDNSYMICGPNANNYYLNVGSTSGASTTMYGTNTCGVWTSSVGALHLNPSTSSNIVYINFFNTSGLLSVGGAIAQAKLLSLIHI